jgi:uncharacterized protein
MKHVLALILVALLLAVGLVASAAPDIPPAPTEWVTDTAGFLAEPTRQTLNTRLEAYEHASGHQVLVWVGKTTGKTQLEDWTVRAFQAWRVGRNGLDDGLVLFLFADDHKARIEVGYGLEGQVPDAVASRIISEVMAPRIKAGDHDGATTAGVDKLLATLGGEGTAGTAAAPTKPLGWFQILLLVLFAIALVLLAVRYPVLAFYILSLLARGGGGGGGRRFGGGGGRSGGGGASGNL